MKEFIRLPDSTSLIIHDFQAPEQYYAIPRTEWERALQEHLKLGHPESHDGRYFAALPNDFTVKVRPYLPNADNTVYYEQDNWLDLPANRVLADIVEHG